MTVRLVPVENVYAIKKKQGVPLELHSCHTGVVGQYFLEGHIPAEDIVRLLKEKPNIKGLAVPGMPMGSPGMEGEYKVDYRVYGVRMDGTLFIYNEH